MKSKRKCLVCSDSRLCGQCSIVDGWHLTIRNVAFGLALFTVGGILGARGQDTHSPAQSFFVASNGTAISGRLAPGPEPTSNLPDAPQASIAPVQQSDRTLQPARRTSAGPFDKFIQQGESAPRLSVGDKIMIGFRGSVSPYAVIGWISSATYSEAINGSPYYGQNGKEYLQRLGAASARATSEDIFTNSVMASVLREDPRYYQMGHGESVFKRAAYSISRVVITKTDAGNASANWAVLTGNLAGSALTQAYYPPASRGFDGVMKTYGTSLLGQAVGDLFEEFILSSAEFLQLKHKIL